MVINDFLKYKTKNIESTDFTVKDIEESKKILFSIFTRYGDTIIDLVVIKEFIQKYNDKEYLILCPKQMVPYVNELLPTVRVIGFNKRNILEFIQVNLLLKKEKFDLGFNPWSNGIDSSYLISFCTKFLFYKEFSKPQIVNHYEVVRKYLKLDFKTWQISEEPLKQTYKSVLICPESTDTHRTLSPEQTTLLVSILKKKYPNINVTIASLDKAYKFDDCNYIQFKKSFVSSLDFLQFIKEVELVICVDSGPLHIMLQLQKDTIAVFNSTVPDVVLNTNSKVKIMEKDLLHKYF